MSKNNSKQQTPNIPDDPKYKEILDSLATSSAASAAAVQSTPVTNLIGSGSGVKWGSGIKQLGN